MIFRNYCSCEPSRTRNKSAKRNVILNAIYGPSEQDDSRASFSSQVPDKSDAQDATSKSAAQSNMDLSKSIQAMTNIISISERLDGSEINAFTDRIDPILDQMKAAGIAKEHQPVVVFSLTTGKARDAAKKGNIHDTTMDELVDHIKECCLYDKDIQSKRATRWQDVKYSDFRAKHTTEDGATRNCIDHLTSFQKDLPKHLTSDASFFDRIKQVFANETWCATLYERSSGYQTAVMFSQAIITAAANFDNLTRSIQSNLGSSHVNHSQNQVITNNVHEAASHNLVAFFAKTPPPHNSRRPFRFRPGNRFYRSRYPSSNHNRYNN